MLAGYLFAGSEPPRIIEAADVNGSGDVNIADLTYFAAFLFSDGSPPQNPKGT